VSGLSPREDGDAQGELTLADPPDVFGVRGIADGPVVHLDPGVLVLCLPDGVGQDVDRALSWALGLAIEDRHPQHHSPAQLACLLILPQDGLLAPVFGLPVEVRGLGRVVGLVRRVAHGAGEHVVGGYVDEEDGPGRAELGQRRGGRNVEGSCAFGVAIAFVWEAVRRTLHALLAPAISRRGGLTMYHGLRSGDD
jgi:hypothetical protein